VPIRVPISSYLEMTATTAGRSETKAPAEKPYKALKTIFGAFDFAGIHNPRVRIDDSAAMATMTLSGPRRSPKYPGIIRPKKLVEGRADRYDVKNRVLIH
jgi:hypothetical protein